ncbi:L-type lectin-domain containing receptor kinase VII.1 [Linum perenne]
MNHLRLLITILFLLILSDQTSAVDFIFNRFNSTANSTTNLLLYGSATVESQILTLTNSTAFTIGRALFPQKIRTKPRNSSHVYPFSTSFIFAMAPYKDTLPGHGLVFLFIPFTGVAGASSSQNLGFLNRTIDNDPNTHIFGVEFDVFANQEFNDIDDNHVGIDLNSLTSRFASPAGYWPDSGGGGFKPLKLNSGENYQVWIDYRDGSMNVTMARAGTRRPRRHLLNVSVDLSEVFEEEMFVGFTAATGRLVQSHKILGWSFSNSNFSFSEGLIATGLPSFVLASDSIVESKGFIAGITVGSFVVLCFGILITVWLIKKKAGKKKDEEEGMEDWELEYWPHRITYKEIEEATKGFSEENVIGVGGNGKVYKGVLPSGEVAVKRISPENDGTREFLAEIASLGRLKHRNLVGLRGWCKREKGTFLLVYDYMENGSLDQWIFDAGGEKFLNWDDRIRVLSDVAAGIRYLHEGWEAKVLHRDIKASNVLLDKEMNGRLGDFGLARMHEHGQVARTTRVVGTAGYLAPEVIHTGRVSTRTDVFGFGILILEVVSGKRPIEGGGKPTLVDATWELMREGKVMECVDPRVRGPDGLGVDKEEVERVIRLGLVCTHPEASTRPTMSQVTKVLEVGRISNDNEVESEDMDAYLLQRSRTDVWMSRYSRSDLGHGWGSHPTMDDVRPTQSSSSASGSWTTTIIEDFGYRKRDQPEWYKNKQMRRTVA